MKYESLNSKNIIRIIRRKLSQNGRYIEKERTYRHLNLPNKFSTQFLKSFSKNLKIGKRQSRRSSCRIGGPFIISRSDRSEQRSIPISSVHLSLISVIANCQKFEKLGCFASCSIANAKNPKQIEKNFIGFTSHEKLFFGICRDPIDAKCPPNVTKWAQVFWWIKMLAPPFKIDDSILKYYTKSFSGANITSLHDYYRAFMV